MIDMKISGIGKPFAGHINSRKEEHDTMDTFKILMADWGEADSLDIVAMFSTDTKLRYAADSMATAISGKACVLDWKPDPEEEGEGSSEFAELKVKDDETGRLNTLTFWNISRQLDPSMEAL